MKVLRAIALLAMLGGLLGAGFVRPAAARPLPDSVSLLVTPAFNGYFKNGEWLTAWAEIENSGKNVNAQLSVQIVSSGSQTTYAVSVSLPAGARKRVPLYILANNYSRELDIQLTGPDGLLASQKITVRPQVNLSFFTGLVAREQGGLTLLNGVTLPGQTRPKTILDVTLADLPERMEGLRSFDLLVFNDVDTSRLTPAQATALADWVFQGGRLVLGGGSGAALTLAGLPADLLPIRLDGQADLAAQDLNALVDFAGGSAIRTSGTFISSKIQAVGAGRLLAGDARQPLLVESSYGDGRVDFIALDLSSAPFNSWPDTIRFWNQLLASSAEYSQNLPADISPRHMYSMDMVNNLSNIPALDLPSIQWLSVLLGVYILLVGPVNYLILRRMRRLQLAWFTIPALTLLFSAGSFGIGSLLHGTDAILNQIAIITPTGGGAATVTNYLGLFSPSQRSYALDVKTPGLLSAMESNNSVNWGAAAPQAVAKNVTFLQGDQPRVSGLNIEQWSFQAFTEEERWSQFGSLRADLHLEDEKVLGTLRNDTQGPLTDVAVIVGSNFVRLGDLAPAEEKAVVLNLTNQGNNRMGMPLSYQMFENMGNAPSSATRKLDVKRSLVSRLLDGVGSKFSGLPFPTSPARSSTKKDLLTATLIAWTDQVPPQVTVEGTPIKKQVIGMVFQKVDLGIGEADVVTIPTGMIPGGLTQIPTGGNRCGDSNANGVIFNSGSAEFKFQLPELKNYRITELQLYLTQDAPPPIVTQVELYDGATKSWTALKSPVLGINQIAQPEIYLDANRTFRVRISHNASQNVYCTYLNLGLRAEKNGGANAGR